MFESARCLALAPLCHLCGSCRLDQEIREARDRGRALGPQPGGLRHLHHEGAAGLLACECPGLLVLRPRPTCRSSAACVLGRDERILRRIHSRLCLPQPFSKSATEHVQGHLVKKQVPPDLFQVCTGSLPCCLPAEPGSPLGSRGHGAWSAPGLAPSPTPASSLSRTSKRSVRTSEGTCSRNSSRGERARAGGKGRQRLF